MQMPQEATLHQQLATKHSRADGCARAFHASANCSPSDCKFDSDVFYGWSPHERLLECSMTGRREA